MGIIPSLAIGAAAFGAGELIFHTKEKIEIKDEKVDFNEAIAKAKNQNNKIYNMVSQVEDENLKLRIKDIYTTTLKIIQTVEKKPEKFDKIENFFDYYLPITLNILNKYDEIENQRLTSEESKKFMKQAENMVSKIDEAFKKQLYNLYQSEMVDTDAEMKVFENMLRSDGFVSEDFKTKKDDGKESD